jgi:DNA-binding transcriptional MerR regulator
VTEAMTIDELAAETGTTTRHLRSLQTMGLLPRPTLRARTGLYGAGHRTRVTAVLRLQEQGFSLRSLSILFAALDRGESLASVLGIGQPEPGRASGTSTDDPDGGSGDSAEWYGFAAFESRQGSGQKPLLWVVPTTMWDEGPASGVA